MPEPMPIADAAFWKGEIDRADAVARAKFASWDEDVQYYRGESPDAKSATAQGSEWVNVNVDFYETELKQAQLFFETPELQLKAKGPFSPVLIAGQPPPPAPPAGPILKAHRELLNELLGPDHADVLTTVQHALKDCLTASGFGATKIGYQGTNRHVEPPQQLGAVLNLQQAIAVPIHESWYWTGFSAKKLLIPADFRDTDYDKAPWLGMRFRMPKSLAVREFNIPETVGGTAARDEYVIDTKELGQSDASGIAYVDGVEVWYRAAITDTDVIHPELFRRHVIVDGVEGFVEKTNESPYQELGADGRLTADSLRGNPIHVLTLRDCPDSAYPPSDARMRRPLVRELCRFRTQMVQERDANRPRWGYDSEKLTPDTIAKIANGTVGDLFALEPGALASGPQSIMAQLISGGTPRQTYLANDYITRDIEKTSGIDASGAGVNDQNADESATKTAVIDRNRNVRLDAERRRVLNWYLKGVAKYSALVCRFMTPALATPYIGQTGAQVWSSWNKKQMDGRLVFEAKPDSQIRLDAAQERKFWLQMYQFTAKDPNTVRIAVLKKLFELSGEDPTQFVVDQLPQKPHEERVNITFKGEDLYNPMAREILAQGGFKISQTSIDEAASQLFKQHALGLRDASGKAVAPTPRPMEHGGVADQVHPLSKHTADQSGERAGRPAMAGAQ